MKYNTYTSRTLLSLGLGLLAQGVMAQQTWSLYPCAEPGQIADYVPTFEKHFKVEDGVLTASANLGAAFFEQHKCSTFQGAGPIWVTRADWPREAANFELTFDYKWFQAEPMAKFGDFPEMTVGLRLNEQGRGYMLQWGMLGQVRLRRMGPRGGLVGQGHHRGMKDLWTKVRVLAAGPILKVKIWPESYRGKTQAEPERWNVEAFDNWEGTDQKDFLKGGVAVGFSARKLFDTCVYNYRNVQLRILSSEETAAVNFFDPSSAPTGRRGSSDVANVAAPEVQPVTAATVADARQSPNLTLKAGEGTLVLSSRDGGNAFAWKKVDLNAKMLVVRAKSSDGARPLVAIDVTDSEGLPQMAYLDPVWREGIGGLFHGDPNHTANVGAFKWKPDTEYDFIVNSGHWLKWQIVEVGDPSNRLNLSAATYVADRRRSQKFLGLGVAGKEGTVTVTGLFAE